MPLLLILVLGIVEFGRAYNIQTTLSAAAREGVRVMALQNSSSAAKAATKSAAAPAVSLAVGRSPSRPAPAPNRPGRTPATATVTVTYPMAFITSFFGAPLTLTGIGVMRCNG